MKKNHKNWQTSEKKLQTCEKGNEKWQIREKKLINLWKKVTESDKLV